MGLFQASNKILVWFVTYLIILAPFCFAKTVRQNRDDDDDDDDDDDRDLRLSDGAIAGIVIAVILIFFGIPVILCFFCSWCCFKRKTTKINRSEVVAVPIAPYQQPEAYNTNFTNTEEDHLPPNPHPNQLPQLQPFTSTTFSGYYNTESETIHIYEPPPPYSDDMDSLPRSETALDITTKKLD